MLLSASAEQKMGKDKNRARENRAIVVLVHVSYVRGKCM